MQKTNKKSLKRLFIAVDLPKELKEKINSLFLEKLCKVRGLKAEKKEKLHITLVFLGYCNAEMQKKAIKAISEIKSKPFFVELSKIENFGNRVIYIKAYSKELEEIAKELKEKLSIKEEKKFVAHITIARNKFANAQDYFSILEKLKKIDIKERFFVNEICLYESKLLPEGSIYEKIFCKKLF